MLGQKDKNMPGVIPTAFIKINGKPQDTPTVIKTKFAFTSGKIYRKYSEKYDCIYYDIDCGCVYRSKYPEGRLACIRLEDEELFYV
jgi:hypothetical protein